MVKYDEWMNERTKPKQYSSSPFFKVRAIMKSTIRKSNVPIKDILFQLFARAYLGKTSNEVS